MGNVNPYKRKIIYSFIGSNYDTLFPNYKDNEFLIKKLTPQEVQAEETLKRNEKKKRFIQQVGFSKLWKEIIQSKKSLVGHNCFADLVFLYSHLIDVLPANYEEFKKSLQQRI